MPDTLGYSYSFSFPRYHFDANDIICPFVTFSFYADEPLISKFELDKGIKSEHWLSEAILSNYDKKFKPQYLDDIEHVLIPVKLSINDEIVGSRNGKPFRQWKHTIEGYVQREVAADSDSAAIKPVVKGYSVSSVPQDNGSILFKVSIETVCRDDIPSLLYQIGSSIEDVPGVPVPLTCNSYNFKDSYDEAGLYVWTVVYEGSAVYWPEGEQFSFPDEEVSVSYELNGSTARTVDGELLALRRSESPIMKKSITVYTDSASPVAVMGSSFKGGIALSESIIKETIKVDGVITGSYYKHSVEVEGTGIDSDNGGD